MDGVAGGVARYDGPGGYRVRGETDERGRPGFCLGDNTGERGASYHGDFQAEDPGRDGIGLRLRLGRRATFRAVGGFGEASGRRSPCRMPTNGRPRWTRSVDKLQSELDESARRNAEMRKSAARHPCRAESTACRPAAVRRHEGRKPARRSDQCRFRPGGEPTRRALKRHPATPNGYAPYRSQIYMLDLVEGGTTLIADEPAPGLNCCGMAKWSHDGSRILFEAGTGAEWPAGAMWAIEVRDGRPTYTDLGEGNDPTFSPDDKRIAFLLHAGNEAGAGGGLWMMRADGSGRHRVGEFGAPFWSPDGREFLINSYSLPTKSAVINLETKDGRRHRGPRASDLLVAELGRARNGGVGPRPQGQV